MRDFISGELIVMVTLGKKINIDISSSGQNLEPLLLDYDEQEFNDFSKSDQSQGKIALLFGLDKGELPAILADENPFRPVLIDRFVF